MAPKKSSKASSPSWRTLRRMAEGVASIAERDKLLKEANRLRRAKRAKTAAKAGPKKPTRTVRQGEITLKLEGSRKEMNLALFGDQNTTMRDGQGGPMAQTQGYAPIPTHEEFVIQARAEEITKLARAKVDNQQEIVRRFECWNRIAELNGRKEAEESNAAVVANLIKQQGINTVASFICAANGLARTNGGPMPRSTVISGYMLARVVDALTQAGYTEDGFKSDGIRRLDRESVINDMVATRTRR